MEWTPFVLASIPAGASLVAAVVASLSARAARRSDSDAQRTRDLENRTAEKKYETYQPMLEWLGRMLVPQERDAAARELPAHMPRFMTWITIYGSDEAVECFHRMMQAIYHSAPTPVLLRLYAEFFLAARRDMGDPETDVTAIQLFGIRINDLYNDEGQSLLAALRDPLDDVYRREGWSPPWKAGSTPRKGQPEVES